MYPKTVLVYTKIDECVFQERGDKDRPCGVVNSGSCISFLMPCMSYIFIIFQSIMLCYFIID